uniref:Claudin n=1 Tax=Dromaius novaehollandiae TaxID=8790 RepID=A0A8C4JCI4_DRONO
MVSTGLQLVGYTVAFLGYVGTLTTTLLPTWKISSYIGSSIVTAVGFTKGLWMECATYSTGITQCDIYSSLLNLPADVQAAQALMVSSSAVSSLACLIAIMGMRCTIFMQGSPAKDRVAVTGGAVFVSLPRCTQELPSPLANQGCPFRGVCEQARRQHQKEVLEYPGSKASSPSLDTNQSQRYNLASSSLGALNHHWPIHN